MTNKPAQDVCFVVSPIGQVGSEQRRHADWVLHGIIEPVFAKSYPDIKVERADKITEPGQINAQVIDRLHQSKLVIADLSFLNANVFYEVGIRHMVEKPIIHMQRVEEVIPFDVSIYRAIKFSLAEFDHMETAKLQLVSMLDDVLKPGYVPNNPVTEARGRAQLKETATPRERIVLDDMSRLQARIEALEASLMNQADTPSRAQKLNLVGTGRILKSYDDHPGETSRWINVLSQVKEMTLLTISTAGLSAYSRKKLREIILSTTGSSSSIKFESSKEEIVVSGPTNDMLSLKNVIESSGLVSSVNVTKI